MSRVGIDVSSWNRCDAFNNVDWEKAKPEIDFAIIRLGFGVGSGTRGTADSKAKYNIKELNRLNIPYGAYWFSYAYTEQMARIEAESVIHYLNEFGAKLSYPVYFDWEYDSESTAKSHGVDVRSNPEVLVRITEAFCGTLKKAGIYSGIYTNNDYINSCYYKSKDILGEDIFDRYDLWFATWYSNSGTTPPANKPKVSGDRTLKMWQFSASGKVSGACTSGGTVDMNECYVDYPSIIGAASVVDVIFSNVKATSFELDLITNETTKELSNWYCNLRSIKSDLDIIKSKIKATSVKNGSIKFNFKNLTPNTPYLLEIYTVENNSSDDATTAINVPNLVVHTKRTWPEPITNISFDTDKEIVSFISPKSWGDVPNVSCGYRVGIKVNGKNCVSKDIAVSPNTLASLVTYKISDLFAQINLTQKDAFQIYLIPWICYDTENKVFPRYGGSYSKQIYIKPQLTEIDKLFLNLENKNNRIIPYLNIK